MATYAGRYSENLQDRYGNGYRNALVAVETLAAAPVTLYADRDKTAYVPASGLAANEIKADSRGNLIFFADPGNYQIVVTPVGGFTLAAFPVSVLPDPLEPDASEGALQAEEDARIAGDALKLDKAGDTMTGPLVLPGDPATDDQAARKLYVDNVGTAAAATAIASANGYTDDQVATRQASDSDLSAIAGLTPANDDLLQRKADAWTNRTLAQVKADLSQAGSSVPSGIVAGNWMAFFGSTTAGYAANEARGTWLWWDAPFSIDRLGCEVTTAQASGVVRPFILRADRTVLIDGGALAADTIGPKDATIATTVVPAGWTLWGVAAQVTASIVLRAVAAGAGRIQFGPAAADLNRGAVYFAAVSGAIPSPMAISSIVASGFPAMRARLA